MNVTSIDISKSETTLRTSKAGIRIAQIKEALHSLFKLDYIFWSSKQGTLSSK